MDFYYGTRSHAVKMLDFLQTIVPCKYKASERLISSDIQNNTFNYKFTFSVELVPICRDDFVCLPKSLARQLGNISQLVVCTKVANSIHFMDPNTLKTCEVASPVYWRQPFHSIASRKQLIEYTVLDIEPLGPAKGKFALADVTVARTRDLGKNDTIFYSRTHLGYLLHPGDTAMGYDVGFMNSNDENANEIDESSFPDLLLVKKSFPERRKNNKKRKWKLKQLEKETEGFTKRDESAAIQDYEMFLQDLEEDKDYRCNLELYKDSSAGHVAEPEDDDQEYDIPLDELLDDMTLEDHEAGPDEEDMMLI
eukprot:Sdes_comp20553_c0_seq1m15318